MHDIFSLMSELLIPSNRTGTLRELERLGLVNKSTIEAWQQELGKREYSERMVSHAIGTQKLKLDGLVEKFGGEISTRKSLGIILPINQLLKEINDPFNFVFDSIHKKTILDFGAGIYSPFAVSLIYWANGFANAIAYEPFPIVTDFAIASVSHTVSNLIQRPEDFNFSGIAHAEFKSRVANLQLGGIAKKLEQFNRRALPIVDLGGVSLINDLTAVNLADVVISNSVLEHVVELKEAMIQLYKRVSDKGLCIHTVDYSDHRAIGTNMNLYEMYYDGVLDNINGLRPSQVEQILVDAGFGGQTVNRLNAPDAMRPKLDQLNNLYSRFSLADLSVWVKTYILRKIG